MKNYLYGLLDAEGIYLRSVIPLASCRVTKRYLLDRAGITDGSVLIFAIPYLSRAAAEDQSRNISIYAVPRDYHGYFRLLSGKLLPLLREKYPDNKFELFSDHSPIDERDAAARAGLGVIGSNGLLITEKYSSLIFLAEIVTDARLGGETHEIKHCENCGLCKKSCPGGCFSENGGECLSALTQKKGALTEDEIKKLRAHPLLWGCDICQEVCPHTVRAVGSGSAYTEIPYFNEKLTPRLTSDVLERMDDAEFLSRAYSWRGRDTILRNIRIKEDE